MRRNRALFMTTEALLGRRPAPRPAAIDMVRDHAACGHRIVLVSGGLTFAGQEYETLPEMLADIRRCARGRYDLPVGDIILIDSPFDPSPFWAVARRCNIDLGRSAFVSEGDEYTAAARNAGIDRLEVLAADSSPVAA